MRVNIMWILVVAVGVVVCLHAVTVDGEEDTATYYDPPYVPSACFGYEDKTPWVAAASEAIWKNGSVCGRWISVKCIGGTNLAPNPCSSTPGPFIVQIVDHCPKCSSTINLSRDAFALIANLSAGKIKIRYEEGL